jgi:serine/threonine protein kinase
MDLLGALQAAHRAGIVPSYMSPERARNQVPSPAVDVWSLGATLCTAVEGRPPFDRRRRDGHAA